MKDYPEEEMWKIKMADITSEGSIMNVILLMAHFEQWQKKSFEP